jgi:hypothetical protein
MIDNAPAKGDLSPHAPCLAKRLGYYKPIRGKTTFPLDFELIQGSLESQANEPFS